MHCKLSYEIELKTILLNKYTVKYIILEMHYELFYDRNS